jgi:hypothetical protein
MSVDVFDVFNDDLNAFVSVELFLKTPDHQTFEIVVFVEQAFVEHGDSR